MFFFEGFFIHICGIYSEFCVDSLINRLQFVSMRGRSYTPSPPRGYGRRGRSPSPRGRYGGRSRDLPTSLLVRNLRHDCRYILVLRVILISMFGSGFVIEY